MYLVQTVSSRPRPWSSYTNISCREVRGPVRMNSAEEIAKYNDHNSHYCSPVLARRIGSTYDFPEKSPKKDKKWTLGSLFRRKKKNESESTSEEEEQTRHFLQKRKKKVDKRKRTNKTTGFDHVVVPPSSRHTISNGYKSHEDSLGILSEPSFASQSMSKNFIPASDFTTRLVPLKDSHESLDRNGLQGSNNSLGSPSISSLGRRKKEVVKARAEARRDNSKGEESSDEDSQKSAFKSDESLTKQSRRSRAARTQRYLKRRSKDEEPKDPLRTCKSDVEHDHSRNVQHMRLPDERMQNMKSASKSPILSTTPKSKLCYTNSAPSSRPNFSGLSTIPPSHSSHGKYRTIGLTNGSPYKHSSSFHDYKDTGNMCASAEFDNQRSLSCDVNMHNQAPSPEFVDEIVHVQFPIGKPFSKRTNMILSQHVSAGRRQPPPPPPRDPRRIITVQNTDGRPISYSFETGYKPKNDSDQQLNKPQPVLEANSNHNLNPNCRSTSEDHISWEPSQRVPLIPRPSSATPEANHLQKISRIYPDNAEKSNSYRYLTDKNPRSRKPICIQSCTNQNDNVHSRVQVNGDQQGKTPKPFDFWRQKDEETSRWNSRKSAPGSPLMFTAQTHVRTNIFLPNGCTIETEIPTATQDSVEREGSPFRPITPNKPPSPPTHSDHIEEKIQNGTVDEVDFMHRKSSNLEDALDELEAIYNSLHLGDEDLLDRAEKREAEAAQKRRDAAFESFPNSVTRGALSDSSFGYDPSFDSTRRKRLTKKSEPDRKADDMAFRKLNKERYNTISDPQSVVSKVSYLLTSPVFNHPVEEPVPHTVKAKTKEPDVTFDDVVYRNVKHTNNSLKTIDPQPPFGIPLGPILPAANSDYLHATPETTQRFTFKPKKIPDVVKDDLAYRNLRKDSNKEPALPQVNFSPDDYINNNNKSGEQMKKKRAVRSLSANIFNLMHKDWKSNITPATNCESQQNIGDVADALEIARQILREKEEKINATRKAFMSDGELKYRKFGCNSPTERRLNFLNDMKTSGLSNNENVYHHKLQVNIPAVDYDRLEAKPPTPDRRSSKPSTKESTPIPTSPSEDAHIKKQAQQTTLDELLSSLAVEAREASERITNELKLIGEEKERKLSLKDSSPLQDKLTTSSLEDQKDKSPSLERPCKIEKDNLSRSSIERKVKDLEEDNISCSLSLHLSEADSTSEHAKLCEKLLECVVDGAELLAATEIESELSEEVGKIKVEPLLPESVANIVLIPSDKSKVDENPVATEVFSESDHDYVNILSNDETEKDVETEAAFIKSADIATDGETNNFWVDIPTESITELGSSTEVDDEEKELLMLDDDSVSADICMSPLEKHKAELVAAFQELKKDRTLKGTSTNHNGWDEIANCKDIDQTDKGGGEECFSVEYIALPTKGCASIKESRFDFDDLYREETERHLNISRFDFNADERDATFTVQNCQNDEGITDISKDYVVRSDNMNVVNECDESEENVATHLEFWHNDCEALDSLKSPKLVQNLNSNYKLASDADKFHLNSYIMESGYGSGDISTSFENTSNNLTDTTDNNSFAKLSSDEILKDNNYRPGVVNDNSNICNYTAEHNSFTKFDLDDRLQQNCDNSVQPFHSQETSFSNLEQRSVVSDLQGKNLGESFSNSTKNNISIDVTDRSSILESQNVDNSKNANSNSSEFQLGSGSRDSRHTLDEAQSSRTWYEDPAVIALACSLGIACTSQLPSFDIIAVLGLLFAIISLLAALISRT